MTTKSFPLEDLAALGATKYLYIRSGEHRFIAVWVVVVEGRVIVRSWNDKAKGWYRAFLAGPLGHVKIGEREAAKYTSKANEKYVKGLRTEKRKRTTMELVPG
jgi:hypothetical protein